MVDLTAEKSTDSLESVIEGPIAGIDGSHIVVTEQQQKEYVLFVTDDNAELLAAAQHLQEKIEQHQENGLKLVVRQVPDTLSAVEFWKRNPLGTPLIIVDKRDPHSPGSNLKLLHSEADPQMLTAVINPYTERTQKDTVIPVGKIQLENFVQTIFRELEEMRIHRGPMLSGLTQEQLARKATTLVDAIDRYLPQYAEHIVTGAEFHEAQRMAELASPEIKLTMVVQTLRGYGGKRDQGSRRKVTAAASLLHTTLQNLPPGITYVTLSEKEGIFAPTAALSGETEENPPVYAVKRFQTLQQARNVHLLSEWLQKDRERRQSQMEVVYIQTPQTYWPLKVDGFSVLFMDAIPGEDLLRHLSRLNDTIRSNASGASEAKASKQNIILIALDNLAYWQTVSQKVAEDIGEYEIEPSQIRRFVENAILSSAKTLETVTDKALSEKDRRLVSLSATELAALVSENPAFGLDTGPKNIRIRKGSQTATLSAAANAIWHVDMPYELKTVHRLRDVVRLLFAPASGLNFEEIERDVAYFTLRGYLFNSQQSGELRTEPARIEEQIELLLKGRTTSGSLSLVKYEIGDVHNDLYGSAVAEAARMAVVIPRVFLSKNMAAREGLIRTNMSREQLEGHFEELRTELKRWTRVGLQTSNELGRYLETGTRDRLMPGLEKLFGTWESATVQPAKLPPYRQFMKV